MNTALLIAASIIQLIGFVIIGFSLGWLPALAIFMLVGGYGVQLTLQAKRNE